MTLALGVPLSGEDVSIFHTQVAPRCRALFEERFLEPMTLEEEAVVVHLGCRTGFHDEELVARAGASTLVGLDASLDAIALAAGSAGAVEGRFGYHPSPLPSLFPEGAFSHAVSLYSLALQGEDWAPLVQEAGRLLRPGGQLLMAIPLRGSYLELLDLLREHGEAIEDDDLLARINTLVVQRPGLEQANEVLEDAGFYDVDIDLHRLKLDYESGADLLIDPLFRLLLAPHLTALAPRGPGAALEHLQVALQRYWSSVSFELSLNIGYLSARR
jgi:SAM-dependent methyltransferase